MALHPLDVAIAGAGPYGLAIASHLRCLNVAFRVFGEPMRFWLDMPKGLFLKSFGFATTIANPHGLRYDEWCRERGLQTLEPCSMESFAEYGLSVQRTLVPEVESQEVVHVAQDGGLFRLTLSGGERLLARRVVVAVGLRYFQRLPPALRSLPAELASHTAQHGNYQRFRDKDVCVIGAGQSALEAATLLREAGARPRLLVRGDGPVFHTKTPLERNLVERLRAPITVLGAGRMHWVLQHFPMLMHYVPERFRVPFTRGYLGPAGAWWLRERFEPHVPVHRRCAVVSARAANGGVVLTVREDGVEREIQADHVVAGTGFEVDVDRLSFLSEDLRARVARVELAPRLDRHFQSSVPGLYFVGVLSMFSFGPLFRFVAGTAVSAPRVARHLARAVERQPVRDVVFSGG
jgi:NADPH-dependent 2,4-dienoyl-CoA reductase/sulfur reductase-like enzyme